MSEINIEVLSNHELKQELYRQADRIALLESLLEEHRDAAEMLWICLANVSDGDWMKQSDEWRKVTVRWRDNYFRVDKKLSSSLPEGKIDRVGGQS